MLPAKSSATIVIVLLPVCSGIDATDHVAEVAVPVRVARPLPPRSLDQPTRFKRMLSVTVPFMVTALPRMAPPVIATTGAMRSRDCQYERSAAARSASSEVCPAPSTVRVGSPAPSSFAPPHPVTAMHAIACKIHHVDRFNCICIPNVTFSFDCLVGAIDLVMGRFVVHGQ
jgi:hypothetical protein